MSTSKLDVEVVQCVRSHPERSPLNVPQIVSLSILDATVLEFDPAAALWIFDAPADEAGRQALSAGQLLSSLRKTLTSYPQWAGQLRWAPYDPYGNHTERHGRLRLSYGDDSDPGVEFAIARCSKPIPDLIPDPEVRSTGMKQWKVENFSSKELLSSARLTPKNMGKDVPGMMVQVTSFSCGGLAIGIKIVHSLADARSLTNFVRDWAAINRAMIMGAHLPSPGPVFDPSLLDRAASGDIDATHPDVTIVEVARSLPLHRYDFWAPSAGAPAWASSRPSEIDPASIGPLQTPIPWSEWDYTARVSHWVVHFTRKELESMRQAAAKDVPTITRFSHMDALLAHVWGLITRARGLIHDERPVYMDLAFDLRPRLSPPLPDSFLGSPIMMARISSTGAEASASTLESPGQIASIIRSTMNQFNYSSLPAYLHDAAHEVNSQRIWQGFLGNRHTIATSWVGQGMYEMDFGAGRPPRFAEGVMQSCDGLIHLVEASPLSKRPGSAMLSSTKHWSDNGVDVSMYLKEDVMERFIKDPSLRRYDFD
ncbi:MAG: hypothetical protein M4579_005585 [Chaenotheca gracillima]|nr:MAG: hypothetical protein M4579_005585 [Chaenotheca gracillima]